MFLDRSGLAIGTWPTLEKSQGICLEFFFLNNLFSIGAIDQQKDLKARFDLIIEMVAGGIITESRILGPDSIKGVIVTDGRILGPDSIIGIIITEGRVFGVESLVDAVITDGRIMLVESLVTNRIIAPEFGIRLRRVFQNVGDIEYAPTLLHHIQAENWTLQKIQEILVRSFLAVSGVMYPIPDTNIDKHCREHPEDPLCWLIGANINSNRGMRFAQELILVSLLHNENLLTYDQTRAIFDTIFKGLTANRGFKDLQIPQGVIIIDGLDLETKQRAAVINSLGINRVGIIDPESPWADICAKENPPPICKFINSFPVAMALTTQLVKFDIWPKEIAHQAWNQMYFEFNES